MRNHTFIIREAGNTKNVEEIMETFHNMPYTVIFDSSLRDKNYGRYSIIAFDPFLVFKSKGNYIEILSGGLNEKIRQNPFSYLKQLFEKYNFHYTANLPFIGGCAGFFSYDLKNLIENLPDNAADDTGIPDIILGFYNNAVVVDHDHDKTYIAVSSAGLKTSEQVESVLEKKFEKIQNAINTPHAVNPEEKMQKNSVRGYFSSPEPNFTKEAYCRMIGKAKEYIRNGEIYQVNLSQRFKTKLGEFEPFGMYKRLRSLNPAPFSAYMNFGELKVLSSSPERFLKIQDRIVETRPIKGTRPRGRTPTEDKRLRSELLSSEKDKAEHIMIVDLERNDLGRVCKTGTVRVEKLLELEEYATVFHLVSTVKGELRDDADVIDCIMATFPGGSITGAPKIRAMEIIDELEPVKRNIYTGSLGYIGFNGNCDLNIAIRTIIIKGNEAFYSVGGGIVWDSSPENEYKETLDKGMALMKVLTGGV